MLDQLEERFELLTQRERTMASMVIVVILWSVLDSLFIAPALSKQQQQQQELASLKTQTEVFRQAAKQLQSDAQNDPNQQNLNQLNALKKELSKLQNQINSGNKQFVSPKLMSTALRDLLKQHSQLKLVKLETLPVASLTGKEQKYSWVFRHGLEMTFSGSYFAVYRYLKSLESLPWRLYWDNIIYQVKEYPTAEVSIQVYTLSFQEAWLGV